MTILLKIPNLEDSVELCPTFLCSWLQHTILVIVDLIRIANKIDYQFEYSLAPVMFNTVKHWSWKNDADIVSQQRIHLMIIVRSTSALMIKKIMMRLWTTYTFSLQLSSQLSFLASAAAAVFLLASLIGLNFSCLLSLGCRHIYDFVIYLLYVNTPITGLKKIMFLVNKLITTIVTPVVQNCSCLGLSSQLT